MDGKQDKEKTNLYAKLITFLERLTLSEEQKADDVIWEALSQKSLEKPEKTPPE